MAYLTTNAVRHSQQQVLHVDEPLGLLRPQLYNEDINDLLAPDNLKLPIHESKESGVYVAGLREDIVVSVEQVMQLLSEGEANRHIGATKMNEGSSRSHTVFRMVGSCGFQGVSWVPLAGYAAVPGGLALLATLEACSSRSHAAW